jgi:hypothetical protein
MLGEQAHSALVATNPSVSAMATSPIMSATTQTVTETEIGQWLFVFNGTRTDARVIGHGNGQREGGTHKRYNPDQR